MGYRRVPDWKRRKPGPARSTVPAPLDAEVLAFVRAAHRAVKMFDALDPKMREAIDAGEVTKLALSRELGWSRQRMHRWLHGKGLGGV